MEMESQGRKGVAGDSKNESLPVGVTDGTAWASEWSSGLVGPYDWGVGKVHLHGRVGSKRKKGTPAVAVVKGDNRIVIRRGRDSREFVLHHVTASTSLEDDVVGQDSSSSLECSLGSMADLSLERSVCLMVYGETGAGKTEVIGNQARPGMFHGLGRRLMDLEAGLTGKVELKLSCNALDVYLETARDLFSGEERRTYQPKGEKHDGYVAREVRGWEALQAAFDAAQAKRLPTRLPNGQLRPGVPNPRTHFIFWITIDQKDLSTGEEATTRLTLVELGGSENMKQPRNTPEATKEHQKCLKGLSALGDVLMAIGSGAPHIPFRNSKLTMALRDSLTKDGVSLLLAVVSPEEVHHSESMNTLNVVSQIMANTAKAQKKPKMIVELD